MGVTITIKPGDTLTKIAKENNTTVDAIVKENNISNPDLIYAGDTLTIGGGTGTKTETDVPATNPTPTTTPTADTNTTPANTTTGTETTDGSNTFTYEPYEGNTFAGNEDPLVSEALDLISQNNANHPGSYTPVWLDEADAYLSQYQNRDPFSYDFNSDALYQQYKDQYIQQGQMAMMDTMGQAASMTGGYGNSYAQTVGQQAYNMYLGKLNEVMPELYGMAYDRYRQEGQDLLNMYNLYMDREAMAYNQYQDTLENWYREDARLTNNYNNLYNQQWNEYVYEDTNARDEYDTARDEAFTEHTNDKKQEAIDKTNAKADLIDLIKSTGHVPTDEELAAAGMTRDEADSYAKIYAENQTAAEKADAWDKVIEKIKIGLTPTQEELDAAGMTSEEAAAYANYFTSNVGDTGGNDEYTELDIDTQKKWRDQAQDAQSWGSLANVWTNMKIAKHDPLKSAEYIMQFANDASKPTYEQLLTFGEKLIRAGVSEDAVTDFIYEWQVAFGLVGDKAPQSVVDRTPNVFVVDRTQKVKDIGPTKAEAR